MVEPCGESMLVRTLCSALSRSEKSVPTSLGIWGRELSIGDCRLFHCVVPAFDSMSSLGEIGVWYRPEKRRALLRRWEKKLSFWLLGGDRRPLVPDEDFCSSSLGSTATGSCEPTFLG